MAVLICVGCLATASTEDVTDLLSKLRISAISAVELSGGFSSIRTGSFTSLSQFRKAFPLKKLLIERHDLFLRPDSRDPVQELSVYLDLTRDDAVADFLAHNHHQLNAALLKLLRSTNDIVIAAVIADPFAMVDAKFLLPITTVLIDYLKVRAGRCLQDLLPDVFQNPAVYDQYFIPLPGYRVIPNLERGYTAIIPDEPVCTNEGSRLVSFVTSGDHSIISIGRCFTNDRSVLVDPRCGCAVSLNPPFKLAHFIEIDKWLVLYNGATSNFHVWRSDSLKPLILPCGGFTSFDTYVDLSRVAFRQAWMSYTLPVDLSVPFTATMLWDMPPSVLMRKRRIVMSVVHIGGDGTAVSLSERGLCRALRYTASMRKSLSDALGTSIAEIQERLSPQADELGMVYFIIHTLHAQAYAECWLLSIELSFRFHLETREEFIAFIVRVVNGYRPVGIEDVPPMRFFIKGGEGRAPLTVMGRGILRYICRLIKSPLIVSRARSALICIAIAMAVSVICQAKADSFIYMSGSTDI